jgi:aspartokinase-like uncharacterized kinase
VIGPLLETLVSAARTHPLAVVPGGGAFADTVRVETDRLAVGDDAAHWMAILAMDQTAHLLVDRAPAARLAGEPRDVAAVIGQGRLAVLAPFTWLRAEDPLPHGWHVTSDSLAAWIAATLGASRLLLLKATPLAAESATPRDAARARIVDDYFPDAVRPGLSCFVADGRRPDDVAAFLSGETARAARLA